MTSKELVFNLDLKIRSRLQPIVDLATNEIVAYEMLSSVLEHNNAEAFFNGLHYDTVFKVLKWQVLLLNVISYKEHPRFSLNISPELLLSKKCIDWICKNSNKKLALEVDYSLLKMHTPPSSSILDMLWSHGHEVWLDDFNGVSDNNLCLDVSWDVVKIDKSVLWGVGVDEGELIRFTTEIKKYHKKILMEGIETVRQIKACQKSLVDLGQGFYWQDVIFSDYQAPTSVNRMIVFPKMLSDCLGCKYE